MLWYRSYGGRGTFPFTSLPAAAAPERVTVIRCLWLQWTTSICDVLCFRFAVALNGKFFLYIFFNKKKKYGKIHTVFGYKILNPKTDLCYFENYFYNSHYLVNIICNKMMLFFYWIRYINIKYILCNHEIILRRKS